MGTPLQPIMFISTTIFPGHLVIVHKWSERAQSSCQKVLPPLSPTPVPLNVIDITMGTDHLEDTMTEHTAMKCTGTHNICGLALRQSTQSQPTF